ncbi:hypothetical protein FQR65_LT08803 [Abscondita terminalis]|nr:hypothetical protein FQR65_LT08803 [Abscondita terminalis]
MSILNCISAMALKLKQFGITILPQALKNFAKNSSKYSRKTDSVCRKQGNGQHMGRTQEMVGNVRQIMAL